MITFTELSTEAGAFSPDPTTNVIALPFDQRQRSRMRAVIYQGPMSGQAIGINLPRGTVLRDGHRLRTRDGDELVVKAADEPLMIARAPDLHALTIIAYHLGNRHVPIQIDEDSLLLESDPVLAEMIKGLGGSVEQSTGPFHPESGAYQSGTSAHSHGPGEQHHGEQRHKHDDSDHTHAHHHRHHGDTNHAPRIHDLGAN